MRIYIYGINGKFKTMGRFGKTMENSKPWVDLGKPWKIQNHV
jgi:hypothetical protein